MRFGLVLVSSLDDKYWSVSRHRCFSLQLVREITAASVPKVGRDPETVGLVCRRQSMMARAGGQRNALRVKCGFPKWIWQGRG